MFRSLGYTTEVTPASRDGVMSIVECKCYAHGATA